MKKQLTYKHASQCTYEHITEARTHYCCRKELRITYSECVSIALGNRKHSSCAVLDWRLGACHDLPYFSILPHKQHDFWGGGLL